MTHSSKAVVRALVLASRRARPPDELAAARSAVRRHVVERAAARGWRCVAAYEPLATEPGSVQLLADLHASGVRVLVPLTLADRDLDWTRWTPDRAAAPLARSAGDLGVDAVRLADAVLVPALAAAQDGTRLGRGRGSYDRALGRLAAPVEVAALLFDGELHEQLPADPWDVPVSAAVTPSGWVRLGGRNTGGAAAR